MKHEMGLYGEYFSKILNGEKTVEVRLNDEKRRKIKCGDIIEFWEVPGQKRSLQVEVVKLERFPTFLEMYESIPFKWFGCEGWEINDMIEGTYEIYSQELEQQWGTLAITIKLITLNSVL